MQSLPHQKRWPPQEKVAAAEHSTRRRAGTRKRVAHLLVAGGWNAAANKKPREIRGGSKQVVKLSAGAMRGASCGAVSCAAATQVTRGHMGTQLCERHPLILCSQPHVTPPCTLVLYQELPRVGAGSGRALSPHSNGQRTATGGTSRIATSGMGPRPSLPWRSSLGHPYGGVP